MDQPNSSPIISFSGIERTSSGQWLQKNNSLILEMVRLKQETQIVSQFQKAIYSDSNNPDCYLYFMLLDALLKKYPCLIHCMQSMITVAFSTIYSIYSHHRKYQNCKKMAFLRKTWVRLFRPFYLDTMRKEIQRSTGTDIQNIRFSSSQKFVLTMLYKQLEIPVEEIRRLLGYDHFQTTKNWDKKSEYVRQRKKERGHISREEQQKNTKKVHLQITAAPAPQQINVMQMKSWLNQIYKLKCYKCGQQFETQWRYIQHLRYHFNRKNSVLQISIRKDLLTKWQWTLFQPLRTSYVQITQLRQRKCLFCQVKCRIAFNPILQKWIFDDCLLAQTENSQSEFLLHSECYKLLDQ